MNVGRSGGLRTRRADTRSGLATLGDARLNQGPPG